MAATTTVAVTGPTPLLLFSVTNRVSLEGLVDLRHSQNAVIKHLQLIIEAARMAFGVTQTTVFVIDELWKVPSDMVQMLQQNDTVFSKQSADLMPDLGTRSDQPASDPMKGLQILLFDPLSRNESHLRPAYGFTDRGGVISIVPLEQEIRLYKL